MQKTLLNDAANKDNESDKSSEKAESSLGDLEVLVKNKAVSVEDVNLFHLKKHSYNFCSGAGIVSKVGSKVNGIKEGDTVIYVNDKILPVAENVTLHSSCVVKAPENFDLLSIVGNLLKVILVKVMISKVFTINDKYTILISKAARPISKTLAICAKLAGAGNVIGLEEYDYSAGAGYDAVLNSSKEGWANRVLHATDKNGVHCFYTSDANKYTNAVDAMSFGGIIVEYEGMSAYQRLISTNLLRRKSLFFATPSFTHYMFSGDVNRLDIIDSIEGVLDGTIHIPYETFKYSGGYVKSAFEYASAEKCEKNSIIIFD